MRCNLQLSDEERSFLILQVLHSLFEVLDRTHVSTLNTSMDSVHIVVVVA